MRKEFIQTYSDSFTDDNGEYRFFVIAAVSELFLSLDTAPQWAVDDDYTAFDEVVKGVKLGFAICNPIDEVDEELGERIAIGRAKKASSYALYSTKPGYINTTMIEAFLKQEAEYLKKNPELYIAGYKRKK